MAVVNGKPGFTQITKLNVTDELLEQGNPIVAAGASLLSNGEIPQWVDGVFLSAGARVDQVTGVWTFDKTIIVPSGSIQVGEVLQLSEGITDLAVINLIEQTFGFSVNAEFDDNTGSSPPTYNNFGASFNLIIQGIDSDLLTDNPLQFSLTGTVTLPNVRLIDRVTLRAASPMTNVRIKITDQFSGLTIRYIPDKVSWDNKENGIDFIAGDNTIYFASNEPNTPGNIYIGFVPFLIENGQVVDIDLEADSVAILGTLSPIPPLVTRQATNGVPYLVAQSHDGPPVQLGDVFGPSSSVDTELAIFNTLTGKLLQGGTNITADIGGDANLKLQSNSPTGQATVSLKDDSGVDMASLSADQANGGRASIISIESIYLVPSDTGEVRIIKPNGADTVPMLHLEDGGANGGISEQFVGDRNPLGNVTALGGSIYYANNGIQSDVFFKRSSSSDTDGWDTLIGIPAYGSINRISGDGGASRALSTTPTILDIWTINGPSFGNTQGDFANNGISFDSILNPVNGDTYQLQISINFTLTNNDEVTFELFYDAGAGEISTGLVTSLKSTRNDSIFGVSGIGNFFGPTTLIGTGIFYVKFSSATAGTITFVDSNFILERLR